MPSEVAKPWNLQLHHTYTSGVWTDHRPSWSSHLNRGPANSLTLPPISNADVTRPVPLTGESHAPPVRSASVCIPRSATYTELFPPAATSAPHGAAPLHVSSPPEWQNAHQVPQHRTPIPFPRIDRRATVTQYHHHRFPHGIESVSEDQNKRLVCCICHKTFQRPSSLSVHVRSHTGEKPFRCTYAGCAKAYPVRSNLTRHQHVHHRGPARSPMLRPR